MYIAQSMSILYQNGNCELINSIVIIELIGIYLL